MATKRFEKISPEKRSAILEAARDEFSRYGFERASLNDILKTAGISKGSFYYYFEDKVDLFATAITEAFEPYLNRLDEVCNVDTPDAYWAELEDYLRETVEDLYRNPELIKLGKGLIQLKTLSSHSQTLTDLITLSRSKIATLVERGRQAGAITTDIPDDLLVNVLNSIDETLDYWSFEHADTLSLLDTEGQSQSHHVPCVLSCSRSPSGVSDYMCTTGAVGSPQKSGTPKRAARRGPAPGMDRGMAGDFPQGHTSSTLKFWTSGAGKYTRNVM